jgi:hypothetical protein
VARVIWPDGHEGNWAVVDTVEGTAHMIAFTTEKEARAWRPCGFDGDECPSDTNKPAPSLPSCPSK